MARENTLFSVIEVMEQEVNYYCLRRFHHYEAAKPSLYSVSVLSRALMESKAYSDAGLVAEKLRNFRQRIWDNPSTNLEQVRNDALGALDLAITRFEQEHAQIVRPSFTTNTGEPVTDPNMIG